MSATTVNPGRRVFFARVFGTAAAASLAVPGAARSAQVAAPPSGPDSWIGRVAGTHRTLFDFPQHKSGLPQLHILNYLNTYMGGYKSAPGTVGAVGTFYGIGGQSSIALAFDDDAWAKYGFGEYLGLKDAAGKPYTRNVFNSPTKDDAHLLFQAMQVPSIAALADVMPALGIGSLQKMGTTFLLCNNALGAWTLELEARGKGTMADIRKDLDAHLLPGVTPVPAMVIAIERAQAAGIRYNRQ